MVFGYFNGHGKCFQTDPGVLLTQMNKTCQKSIIDWTTRGIVTAVLIFTYSILRFIIQPKNSIKLYIFIIDVIEPNLYRTYKCSFWTSIWYNSVQSDSSIFSNHFPDFNHLVFELVWSFISQILSLEILVVVEYPSARFTAISRRVHYP